MTQTKISFKKSKRVSQVGEYYFSKKLGEIARMKAKGIPVLNLGIGNPDQPPHPSVIEALAKNCQDVDLHGYQSYRGILELRAAFAEWYMRYYQVSINPEKEVLPLIGSKEGIMHIAMSFLEEGDLALVPDPAYPSYEAATRLAGAKSIKYTLKPEKNWLPDFEALEQLDLERVRIMWLNYPHMPTGTGGNKELFQRLVDFAHKHEILLVHDNPYSFILNEPASLLATPGAKDVVIELNSLSKSHNMAGWRIGAMFAKNELIETVLRFKSNMDSGQFKPMQLASIQALKLGADWYEKQNQMYRARRRKVQEILSRLGCSFKEDQAGLFVWARIPEGYADGFEFSENLLQNAWLFITPGGIFGEGGKQYVRMSLCNSEANLKEALERIKKMETGNNLAQSQGANQQG